MERALELSRVKCVNRWKGFQAKDRYADEHSARYALKVMAERHPEKPPVDTYLCPSCDGWHLTSSVKRHRPHKPETPAISQTPTNLPDVVACERCGAYHFDGYCAVSTLTRP